MTPDQLGAFMMDFQRDDLDMSRRMGYKDILRLTKYIDDKFLSQYCCLYTCSESSQKQMSFYFNGKRVGLLRLLFYNYIGDIDDNFYIRSSCKTKYCCNPSHISKFLKSYRGVKPSEKK